MAEPQTPPATGLNLEKLNVYGASDQQLQNIKDALEQNLTALENRYSQPNWFKVAAGFAKPQLGGFLASLGSASEAMGETVELQRAQEMPIAQMRAQLAQTDMVINQNRVAADMVAERRAKGLPITADFVGEVVARAPDSPVAKSLQSELGTMQKQQEITSGMQSNALKAINEARQAGIEVSPQMYLQAGLRPPGYTGPMPGEGGVAQPSTGEYTSGAQQPTIVQPSAPGTQPPAGGAPSKEEPAKVSFSTSATYGTPSKLLDNLHIQESSGGKNLLNPDSKALGHYQFTPETLVMLHNMGVKFNPLDEKESRAAADWYLNYLNEKNSGDWNKTLADYGGFKKKDPSEYIKNVTAGVDFGKKEEPTAAKKPETGTEPKKVIPTGGATFNVLYTPADVAEGRSQDAKEQNKVANARYASLEAVGNPRTYAEDQQAITAMIDTITNNKKLAQAVTDPLSKSGGGLLGGVLSGAEKGFGFNVANIGGNINFPVSEAIIGSYNPQERKYWQQLTQQASRIAQIQQQMNNINPSSIRSGEIELYKNVTANPRLQGPDVLLYNLYYTKLNSQMLHEMYDRANKIQSGQDPQYMVNPQSRTPMRDIMTSGAMEDITNRYNDKFKALNTQFEKSLGMK